MNSLMQRLARHPFVEQLSPEHLAAISEGAQEIVFEPGEVIFRESGPAGEFYLIEEGRVQLDAHASGRGEVPIQTLGGGDVLGWSWLFPPFVWQFRATCLERTRAISLKGGHLLVSCEEDHDLGYELMKRVAQMVIGRLQAARRRLIDARSTPWTPAPVSQGVKPQSGSDLEAAVANHPFLTGLAAAHLKIMAAHAMQSHFAGGEMVFKTGDPANRFYLLQNGRVSLEAPSADGPVLIQIIGEGDVLGWSWLYEPYVWHFDARALQPTSAIFFYGTRIRELCETDHDFGYGLMRRITHVVIQRLQATRRQLVNMQS